MLYGILIFILFLCPLVFFHELGHFIFAKLFGVRVEVFSIGFGPKILKFKKGDTEYAFSLIPLGGYVKMFGEDPLQSEGITEEQKQYSLTHKSKWARFWIVLGGPLFNIIFAYALFVGLFMSGERMPEIRFGIVPEQTTAYELGFRSADIIREINGKEINSPSDILMDESTIIRSVKVFRNNQMTEVMPAVTFKEFFDEFGKYSSPLRQPIIISEKGEGFAVSFYPNYVDWTISLDEMSTMSDKTKLYLFAVTLPKDNSTEKSSHFAKLDTKNTFDQELSLNFTTPTEFYASLQLKKLYPSDLLVKSLKINSPAYNAGIVAGDIILKIQGTAIASFDNLRNILQHSKGPTVSVEILHNGEVLQKQLTPEVVLEKDKSVKLIGVFSAGLYHMPKYVNTRPKGILESLYLAFPKTWDVTLQTTVAFKNLFTGNMSLKNLGGPIAIGQVAADSFRTSLSYFFQIMAIISVNLAIINLLPIPVLDGGHIMFIILELINRGPLSQRKMEIAQQVGLSLLLLLMFAAIFNDVTRLF